jgi:hypothetical protein
MRDGTPADLIDHDGSGAGKDEDESAERFGEELVAHN